MNDLVPIAGDSVAISYRPGGVLALDLSLRVGVAYGYPGDRPHAEAWKLGGGMHSLGEVSAALDQTLCDAIDIFQPARLVVEAPLVGKWQTSAELMLGLWWRVQETAWHHELRVEKVAANTARLGVLGRGYLGKSAEAKSVVMDWCRTVGWSVNGDDEADAMLLWAYATGIRYQPAQRVLIAQTSERGPDRLIGVLGAGDKRHR